MTSVTQKFKHESTSEIPRDGVFFLFVIPIADVGCQKKCLAMVKVGLSRFQKLIGGIGKRVSQIVLKMSGHFSFLNAVIPERFF